VLRRLGILALTAVALTGCGGSDDSGTTSAAVGTTTATTVATTEAQSDGLALKTFFYRDGALVPTTAVVKPTKEVAHAALEELLGGPPAGYESAIPKGVELETVVINDGVAVASFSGTLGAPTRRAQGQIVSALTQFPSVRGVTIEAGGEPVLLQDGAGQTLTRPATSADYGDLTSDAFIFVRTPERDSTVTSPVEASGTATVFEANIQLEIWQGDKLVGTKTITASEGAPQRGTWSARLDLPKGDVRLVFFEPSAEDGSHLHETEVRLHVQ